MLDLDALDLGAAQVTAVVGPNGAGKTTLLRLLAFLESPASGTLEFRGRRVPDADRAALRRQVTLVAQSPLLFRRTVRANVAYGVRARSLPSEARVDAALAAVGLSEFGDRPAWTLSGGEAQRVAIARALAIDPPVFLFDEPTANVDRGYVRVIESLIRQLGERGKTAIFTTHDLEQAYRLSDAVVALAGGRVVASPPANVLRGATEQREGITYFVSHGLRIEIPDGTAPEAIAIDPEDIIVSRRPLDSSARNCFPGHILKAERDARGIVLAIDCGVPLLARITAHSYAEMGLNLGAPVFLTFKSSAIHTGPAA